MEKISVSSNLYSHSDPEKLLEDHLINVAKLMLIFLSEKPADVRQELLETAKIIGLSHDLGKATNSFQKYLFADEEQKQRLKTELTRHSLFSAICAYHIAKNNSKNELFPLFAYITVRRHHGNLIDVIDEVSLFDEKDIYLLQKQLDDIDESAFTILSNKLYLEGLPVLLNKELIQKWIGNFKNDIKTLKRLLRKNSNIKNYITLNLLYSLLIDADKSEVVIGDLKSFQRKVYEDKHWVDNYLPSVQSKQEFISKLRGQAYTEVNNHEINLDKKIYSINLPTGMGKTLTGLSFALKLKNKLKHSGVMPRIIYSLPFLSIIDQNAKVFTEVIKNNELDVTSDILLTHHHLSELYYKTEEHEYESDEAKILIEGWNAEIIVTTFVQLFHTLLSNKNSTLRKFHKLSNSIIILDEIQSIPIKYWMITREILTALSEVLNAYIIIMTATEPLIFTKENREELTNSSNYFKILNRFEIQTQINQYTSIEELIREIKIDSDKKILFIFNTISSAKNFYTLLENIPISKTFLSTHIVPKERIKRINEIKQGKYRVVVATQLVEAGVDIDFEVVIRDFAPFDCIVQSAGRCNRNASKDQKGIIKICKLKNDQGRYYASYIYDPVLLDITEKLLIEKQSWQECEIYQLLEKYYFLTKERINQKDSEEILEAVLKLRYDRENEEKLSIADFQLIEEDYPKIDVFIEYDEEAKKIWERFQKIKEIKNFFDRKREFLVIRKEFYNHIISIPAKIENLPPKVNDTFYVSQTQLKEYYDLETGYKANAETLLW